MKIIILGAGRRGLRLAKRLSEEKKDVVLIDTKKHLVANAMQKIDCIAYVGSGTSLENLSDAGVEDADAFVSLTGDDEINMVSCAMVHHEFKVPLTIASIRNTSYTGSSGIESNLLGISHIVNTDFEVASTIYEEIEEGVFTDVIGFQNSGLTIYNLLIKESSEFANISVQDFRKKINTDAVIVAINRNNEAFVPSGSTILLADDTISVVVEEDDKSKTLQLVGKPRVKPKRIVLVGATQVTKILLKKFSAQERSRIALIEKDPAICKDFAQDFPEVLTLNTSISEEGVFEEEQLDQYDLMICLTDSDELNIIIASYCKQMGIKYSMALIRSNNNYLRMSSHMNIDSVISAQEVTVDSITSFFHGKNVSSMHTMFEGKIEVFEYIIQPKAQVCGKKLKEINMQKKALIAGISKEGKGSAQIPDGNTMLEAGDVVILIVDRDSSETITRMFD